MPLGTCVTLTALSVVLTCCPPAPELLNVSKIRSRGSKVTAFFSVSSSSRGINSYCGKCRMSLSLGAERAHPNETMRTSFRAEVTKSPKSSYLQCKRAIRSIRSDHLKRLYVTVTLVIGSVDYFNLPAHSFAPSLIHLSNYANPIPRIFTSCPCSNSDKGTTIIKFIIIEDTFTLALFQNSFEILKVCRQILVVILNQLPKLIDIIASGN